MGILLKQRLPKGKDIIFLTSLETEVTQIFYLAYQLASSCSTYLSWNTLFINQWNQPTHTSLTITSAASYMIWELLPNRYVFCVTQLCVCLLPGSAQDIRMHNALKGLTSTEKRVSQGKAKLGYGINHRLWQQEISGSLISLASAEMTLLRALHSITAHMCICWLHPSPQHHLSSLGTPQQPPSSPGPATTSYPFKQLLKELPSSNVYQLVYSWEPWKGPCLSSIHTLCFGPHSSAFSPLSEIFFWIVSSLKTYRTWRHAKTYHAHNLTLFIACMDHLWALLQVFTLFSSWRVLAWGTEDAFHFPSIFSSLLPLYCIITFCLLSEVPAAFQIAPCWYLVPLIFFCLVLHQS